MKSSQLILIVVILAVFYFLMIVPQRRQQKKRQELMNRLGIGAKVVSAGGIHGEVTEIFDDAVMLEIAPDIEIKIERRSIVRVLEPGAVDEETDADEADDEDEYEGEYEEEDTGETEAEEETAEKTADTAVGADEAVTNEAEGQQDVQPQSRQ